MTVVTQQEARKGRLPEFFLLVLALGITFFAWFMVTNSVSDSPGSSLLPANFVPVAAVVSGIVFGAHLLIRWRAPYADPILFPTAVLLTGLGMVMIHRIDFALQSAEAAGQYKLAIVGVVLMLITIFALRDHRLLRRFTWLSFIAGIIMLLLPMVPGLGRSNYGARLWINLGGFSYQPAELAKILLVIFFAGYLVVQRDNLALAGKKVGNIHLPQLRHLAPVLVAWLLSLAILALEKDFGTAILFFGIFIAVLYVATERVSWILIGGVLSAVGMYVVVQLMPHIQARINVWLNALNPEVYDAQYGSYQLVQGWFGMASGGLFGTGWGEGYPTKSFAANSDFIIASFGEELGLFGVLAILSLYLILVSRAFNTGMHLRDGFGKLLAAGLGFAIALQVFVVVGGVTRVIPLTGLALPFMALGGSALLTNWIIIGILIRMSDSARRPYRPATTPLSELDSGELRFVDDDDARPAAPAAQNTNDSDENDGLETEVVKL